MTHPSQTDPECVFCRIVAGQIPSRQVYADEAAIAFLDVDPLKRGHTLVVPRAHVSDALAGPEEWAAMAPAIAATGTLLRERLGASALNIVSNVGEDAGQSVFHLHVHLVPRYADAPGLANLVRPTDVGADELDAVHAAIVGA